MQTAVKNLNNKNTSYKLNVQVQKILFEKGYSKVFNIQDYLYFKELSKDKFNKAQAIAELFIFDNQQNSDYNEYLF